MLFICLNVCYEFTLYCVINLFWLFYIIDLLGGWGGGVTFSVSLFLDTLYFVLLISVGKYFTLLFIS